MKPENISCIKFSTGYCMDGVQNLVKNMHIPSPGFGNLTRIEMTDGRVIEHYGDITIFYSPEAK